MSKRTVTATQNAAATKDSTPQRGSCPSDDTEFLQLLDLLGISDDERISICSLTPGRKFDHTTPKDRNDAVRLAVSKSYSTRDVWFSVNPVQVPEDYFGRGGDEHVTRCVALYADIDVKAGGVTDTETAEKVALDISAALGVKVAAVVFTGHGGHAYWLLDVGDDAWTLDTPAKRAAAQAVYRRFHRLCAEVAERYGCGIDNVAQLSRILRVPGTFNHKGPTDPVGVELTVHPYGQPSAPLTFEQVCAALDDAGVPERPEDAEILGAVVKDIGEWEFGEQTHPFVAAMVKGWHTDVPRAGVERHNWLVAQATRLACAHRLGAVTADGHAEAAEVLEMAFLRILAEHGDPRDPMPANEFDAALGWGVERSARKTDAEAVTDLGLDPDDNLQDEGGAGSTAATTLPAWFWESSPVLQHVRAAAWSMMASPDAVLAIIMAKLAASIPPGVRVDTGVRRPMPMHTFAALVGRSGGFKSTAMEAADLAVTFTPDWVQSFMSVDAPIMVPVEDYRGGDTELVYVARLGTGQGIVENFMGDVPIIAADGTEKKGRNATRREQVRSNVLVTIDEGNGLAKALADPQSIVGETLRELWSGADSGQGNAKQENKRGVKRGTYSFAMVIGFQLSVLERLLGGEHVELGTPQRFLFAWTGAPDIPDEPISDPGVLTVTVPNTQITLCPALLDHLRQVLLPLLRNGGADSDTDSQRLSVLVRLAALLAILDGRTEASEQDWHLAETMADTSKAIADHALSLKRERETRAKQIRRDDLVKDAIAVHEATAASGPERAAARIETAIRDKGGTARWSGEKGIRKIMFNHDDREDADAGLDLLVQRGKVLRVERGQSTDLELVGE